jgi:hypothetical protein
VRVPNLPGDRASPSDALRSTGRACTLLLALVGLAWGTGQPFLFPSLGPSAYALAVSPSAATSQHERIVGGHLFGVVGGMLAYHTLAPGLSVVHVPPAMSPAGLRLVASGLVAVGLTTAAMLLTDLRHPPACATTLIVGLGLLTTPVEAGIVVLAVALLVAVDRLVPGVGVGGGGGGGDLSA